MDIPVQLKTVSTHLWLVLVCLGVSGCLSVRPLPPHQGDGIFQDISWRFPYDHLGFTVEGYQVLFPEFNLGEAYEAEFKVAGLPDIPQRIGVYLLLSDPDDKVREEEERRRNERQENQDGQDSLDDDFKDGLSAVWEFEVRDSQNHVVISVKRPLSELTWSTPSRHKGYGIYAFSPSADEEGKGSHFQYRKGEHYTLRVRYRPDAQLRPFRGRVYLQCGGGI